MPSIFISWLLLRFGAMVLRVTLALTALLSLFDLLARASEISANANNLLFAIVFYLLLRLPIIAVFILPFAVLIASVQFFFTLAAQREILTLEASGFTLPRIVLTLLTGTLLLAGAQFFFADHFVSDAQERLNEWKGNDYKGFPKFHTLHDSPPWVSSENFLIQTGGVNPDGTILKSPTIIQTSPEGVATHYFNAQSAIYKAGSSNSKDEGYWILKNVVSRDLKLQTENHISEIPLPITLKPQDFSSFSKPVEELQFFELFALGWQGIPSQIQAASFYQVQANFRISQALSSLVMILLAAPICLQVQRNSRRLHFSIAVFALGFLYFILQSIFLALGENASLPPSVAAWGAFVCFGLLGTLAVFFRIK